MKTLLLFLFTTSSLLAEDITSSKDSLCRDLNDGEVVNVFIGNVKSPTTVTHYHTLRKVSSNHHEVYLNLEFSAGAKTDMSDYELNAFYKAKATSCIEKHQKNLIDSRGRKLSLMIYDEVKHKSILGKVPYLVTIQIQKRGYRSNSRNYEKNLDCETYMHELF